MSEISVKKTNSSNSTDSWSIIEDECYSESQELFETINHKDFPLDHEKCPLYYQTELEHSKNEGFLTFDEYLQERLIEHDYDFDDKPEKLKKKCKKSWNRRKCKARAFGIAFFITFVISLSVSTLISSLIAQSRIKTQEKMILRNHPTIKSESLHKDAVIKEINRTIRELEEMKSLNLPWCSGDKLKNVTDSCPKIVGPRKPFDNVKLLLNRTEKIIGPLKHQNNTENLLNHGTKKINTNYTKSAKPNLNFMETNKPILKNKSKPISKDNWLILKNLMFNSNFHAIVSLIVTNIYLFTLLIDLSRKNVDDENHTPRDISYEDLELLWKENEDLRRNLFDELPFKTDELFKGAKKMKKNKTKKMLEETALKVSKKTAGPVVKKENEEINHRNFLLESCPQFLSRTESKFVIPISAPPNSEESGKSECERRFDELDLYQKKFDSLKQSQRERIKLLKQKYKNEVSYIRDTEEESDARAEKISRTSQRFIKKMKLNRDKYLLELKKVRELRKKSTDEKRKRENSKDASVGNYAVAIPSVYRFGESLKIQEEQAKKNPKSHKIIF